MVLVIFTSIYHKDQPSVGNYPIRGSYGHPFLFLRHQHVNYVTQQLTKIHILGVGFVFFIFTPREMIQFDEHIFQLGWFNHQVDIPFMASQRTPPNTPGGIWPY